METSSLIEELKTLISDNKPTDDCEMGFDNGVAECIRIIKAHQARSSEIPVVDELELHGILLDAYNEATRFSGTDIGISAVIEVLRPYLAIRKPVAENHLDHIREKLRGAASDCNVRLEQDQVRYITKAVLDAAEGKIS